MSAPESAVLALQARSVFLGRNFRSPRMQREREQETKRIAISYLSPRRAEPACILPQHALDEGGKRNGLKRRVADLLIYG